MTDVITFGASPVRTTGSASEAVVRMSETHDILPERPVEPFNPEQEVAFAALRQMMAGRKRTTKK